MNETIIKIPDLRVIFKEDVGAITFPNIKEIVLSKLVDTYFAFGNALRGMPGILTNRHGDIISFRQN